MSSRLSWRFPSEVYWAQYCICEKLCELHKRDHISLNSAKVSLCCSLSSFKYSLPHAHVCILDNPPIGILWPTLWILSILNHYNHSSTRQGSTNLGADSRYTFTRVMHIHTSSSLQLQKLSQQKWHMVRIWINFLLILQNPIILLITMFTYTCKHRYNNPWNAVTLFRSCKSEEKLKKP